jgi:phosphatidate cytidylyltransferase
MALAQLRLLSPFALLMVMVLVWLADSAAYFAGRRFGKHKLAPKTSPGKTREGAIGAFVAVTIYAAVLAPFVMPKLSQLATLPSSLAWGIWLALAWLLLFLSILGDLFESLIKRFADQKDSGVILPGHGGWLDRVDSLLTTLPTAALAVSFLI